MYEARSLGYFNTLSAIDDLANRFQSLQNRSYEVCKVAGCVALSALNFADVPLTSCPSLPRAKCLYFGGRTPGNIEDIHCEWSSWLLANSWHNAINVPAAWQHQLELLWSEELHVKSFAFSASTGRIAIATRLFQNAVVVWGINERRELSRTFMRSPCSSVALSPDGETVAVGCVDGGVRLCDISSGKHETISQGLNEAVFRLLYSPNGKILCFAYLDGSTNIWNGDRLRVLPLPSLYLDISPNSALLARGWEGTISIWDLSTLTVQSALSHVPGESTATLRFYGNTKIVSATRTGIVHLWDIAMGTCLAAYQAPSLVSSIEVSVEREEVLLRTMRAGLIVLRLPLLSHPEFGPACDVAWLLPGCRDVLCAGGKESDGFSYAALWKRGTSGTHPHTGVLCFSGEPSLVDIQDATKAQLGPQKLAAARHAGYHVPFHDSLRKPWGDFRARLSLRISDSGAAVVGVRKDSAMEWDVRTWQVLMSHPVRLPLALSPLPVSEWHTSTFLGGGSVSPTIVESLPGRGIPEHHPLYFPSNGNIVVSGAAGGVCVWSALSGELLRTLRVPSHPAEALVTSPDGMCVAAACRSDVVVWVWKKDISLHENAWSRNNVNDSEPCSSSNSFSGGSNGTISRRNRSCWPPRRPLAGHDISTHSPLGKASCSSRDQLHANSGTDSFERTTFSGHTETVLCLALSPCGHRLVTGGLDMTIRVWGIGWPVRKPVLRGHTDNITVLHFLRNSDVILSGSMDGSIRTWHVGSGKSHVLHTFETGVVAIEMSLTGKLVVCLANGRVIVLSAPSGRYLYY
eukprot:Rmarinus@m.6410